MTANSSQIDYVSVPINLALYQELIRRHGIAANEVIQYQVEMFLERTQDDSFIDQTFGIAWEKLFLPEGTQLRTKYYREYKYAEVKKDKIVYEDKNFPSVSSAVNVMRGGTQNNAWNVVEIQRPVDSSWISAKHLRNR